MFSAVGDDHRVRRRRHRLHSPVAATFSDARCCVPSMNVRAGVDVERVVSTQAVKANGFDVRMAQRNATKRHVCRVKVGGLLRRCCP